MVNKHIWGWERSTCFHRTYWFSTNHSNIRREHELSTNAESALNLLQMTWRTVGGHFPASPVLDPLLPFSPFQPHYLTHHCVAAVYHKTLMLSAPAESTHFKPCRPLNDRQYVLIIRPQLLAIDFGTVGVPGNLVGDKLKVQQFYWFYFSFF